MLTEAIKRDWGDTPPEPVVVPEPEVGARDAEPDEIPKGAKTVINHAHKYGWDTVATYARGTWLEADGTPAYVVDSILVRFRHQTTGQRAAATWVRKPIGKHAYAYSSGHWQGRLGLVKSDDLKLMMKDHAS